MTSDHPEHRPAADQRPGDRAGRVVLAVVITLLVLVLLAAGTIVFLFSRMFDSSGTNAKAVDAARDIANSLARAYGEPPPAGQQQEQYLREATTHYPAEVLNLRSADQTVITVRVDGVWSAVPGPVDVKKCFEFRVPVRPDGRSVPYTELAQCPAAPAPPSVS